MRGYAVKYGSDPDYWALAGLLHDFDWEIHPSLDQHPQDGAAHTARAWRCPKKSSAAFRATPRTPACRAKTPMEKSLFAVDELTGLITACAWWRPSKSLSDLTAKSSKASGKTRPFAAGVNRADIEQGAQELAWT